MAWSLASWASLLPLGRTGLLLAVRSLPGSLGAWEHPLFLGEERQSLQGSVGFLHPPDMSPNSSALRMAEKFLEGDWGTRGAGGGGTCSGPGPPWVSFRPEHGETTACP